MSLESLVKNNPEKTSSEIVDLLLEDTELYEMSSVTPKYTKLPYTLWIDDSGKDGNYGYEHNLPRLKVDINKDYYPLTIDKDNPEFIDGWGEDKHHVKQSDLNKIKQFVRDYYDEIMAQFNREWDVTELNIYLRMRIIQGLSSKDALNLMLDHGDIEEVPESLKKYL